MNTVWKSNLRLPYCMKPTPQFSRLSMVCLSLFTTAFVAAGASRGAKNNVPEAAAYTLVYSLNIPNTPNYLLGITYDTDLRAEVSGFSRVAYYLELQEADGPLNYIWVSMDAFTNKTGQIGVPTAASGANFQQPVANLNVFSSVAEIVTGTGLQGGNLEFWPNNYDPPNAAAVPNASDDSFDWGDQPVPGGNVGNVVGTYGSMQVHNAGANQVLFAFNRWGFPGGNADLGIGNNTQNDNPDWTLMQNAANYTIKTLEVYALAVIDTNPPVILGALGVFGLTNVTLTFSQALDESATNAAFYSINGGVTVIRATLDPITKDTVTLTTTRQQALTPYRVTVNGVLGRTSNHLPVAPNSTVDFISSITRGAINNVPEAVDYALVYSLEIPNGPDYSADITYDVDLRSRFVTEPFTRLAYYLELQKAGQPLNFIWVSMDPFTTDVNQIGVPTAASGARFQAMVANMNVLSSVASVVNGNNFQEGNIEFWSGNYNQPNEAGVPNASDALYDFGDRFYPGSYSCMQVHNAGERQTLFAFNCWSGATGKADLGIGPYTGNPTFATDWTFAQNDATYIVKSLQIYAQPLPSVTQPFNIIQSQIPSKGQFSLTWQAQPGVSYSVLRKNSLDASPWVKLGGVTATNNTAVFIDLQATNQTGFYRVSIP